MPIYGFEANKITCMVSADYYSSKVPEQKMKDPICTEQGQYTRKHYYYNL